MPKTRGTGSPRSKRQSTATDSAEMERAIQKVLTEQRARQALWERQADQWMESRADLSVWALRRMMVHMQMADYRATNAEGLADAKEAMASSKEFKDMVGMILEAHDPVRRAARQGGGESRERGPSSTARPGGGSGKRGSK